MTELASSTFGHGTLKAGAAAQARQAGLLQSVLPCFAASSCSECSRASGLAAKDGIGKHAAGAKDASDAGTRQAPRRRTGRFCSVLRN